MSSHKIWRPFEDLLEDEAKKPSAESPTTRTTVTYTFDLNRQRSQPIGYILMSPPKQVVSSQTSLQHLNGHQMSIPVQSTAQDNWSKVRQRYIGYQPKPAYDENRSQAVGAEKARFKCDYEGCSKIFIYKSALESHRLVHSSERRFQCCFCDKRYKQMSGLYSHQSVKHSERSQRFVCNECHYSFADYRNLRIHEYNQHMKNAVVNYMAFEREI